MTGIEGSILISFSSTIIGVPVFGSKSVWYCAERNFWST